jgi:hypothetical protein
MYIIDFRKRVNIDSESGEVQCDENDGNRQGQKNSIVMSRLRRLDNESGKYRSKDGNEMPNDLPSQYLTRRNVLLDNGILSSPTTAFLVSQSSYRQAMHICKEIDGCRDRRLRTHLFKKTVENGKSPRGSIASEVMDPTVEVNFNGYFQERKKMNSVASWMF